MVPESAGWPDVTWRAWLGMGDADRMDQIDVAEFATAEAARAWVENRLTTAWSRPGMKVFGSIDRGTYVADRPGTARRWVFVDSPEAMDAHLADGRVHWHRPGTPVQADQPA